MTYSVVIAIPPVAADDEDAWSELDTLIESEGPVPAVFDEFLARVTSRYPCLTELADDRLNEGVWSDAPLQKSLGHRASVFRIASRGKEVAAFLATEANALGLVVLNTASHTIHRPGPEASGVRASRPLVSLAFFNKLSGKLRITLSEPTKRIVEQLENQKAPPSAVILSLRLDASVYENDDFRDLTEQELAGVALPESEVVLGSHGREIRHAAPNGAHFTVRDLLAAVEETERQTRGNSEWFEGVDVHHVFFEGIRLEEDGVWNINWGS